ncbi:carboxypeptidase S [Dacryopinax primogenitus]|uniref:Carboxypeptidase S n=1 Tax=Dacryopinax primogenitus (strain DJM 731) TaxID=1858805 RepID=M5FRJ9_DACPD|nr:carboxypeptidase S [Dacryopinax primogenitus]EJT98323.1 carboxypeptidase S [Dacryopinax primogenitus]
MDKLDTETHLPLTGRPSYGPRRRSRRFGLEVYVDVRAIPLLYLLYVAWAFLLSGKVFDTFDRWAEVIESSKWYLDIFHPVELHNYGRCVQPEGLVPSNRALVDTIYADFWNEVFQNKSAELLGAAVQIETESYDDLGEVDKDPRWEEKYAPLHQWLEGAFPHVYKALQVETVNTWGLVYTWQGSDPSIKPILLAAHQDTVPVDRKTMSEWVHPPFSGYYDGDYIWGRGTCDDKEQLVGALIALELLAKHEFKPTRTIILASGFDEEISGMHGARTIGELLLGRYGEEGIAFVIDEGAGYGDLLGRTVAVPAIGERGHVDVKVQVNYKGGHSSVPPGNTGIDILSDMVHTLNRNPPKAFLSQKNPFYDTLQCLAAYSPDLPDSVRKDIIRSSSSSSALKRVTNWVLGLPSGPLSPLGGTLIRTTQASTVIQGGVKVNALPEQSYVLINHRIVPGSSVAQAQDRISSLLTPTAEAYNLSLSAFGKSVIPSTGKEGSVFIGEAFSPGLEPAPITPQAAEWRLFGGTIRAEWAKRGPSLKSGSDEEIIVAPGVMNVNTDTRHYWKLTKNIFRYAHLDPKGMYNGLHTVNEAITLDNFLGHVRFMALLILNSDETRTF